MMKSAFTIMCIPNPALKTPANYINLNISGTEHKEF